MKITLIILGAALLVAGVWWFFIRKKPAAAPAPNTYSPGPSMPQYPIVGRASLAPPVGTPGGGSVSVGTRLEQGVALAATAGCASAAAAYTGGAAIPLCGLAGPLAVSAAQTAAKAGGAVVGLFKSIF